MKINALYICLSMLLLASAVLLASFTSGPGPVLKKIKLPYKQAGLTERQAAAHLLERFTYGPTPGQIEEVVKMGLEEWLAQQLQAGLPDKELNKRLKNFRTLQLSSEQIAQTYPKKGQVVKMAIREGYIDKGIKEKDLSDKSKRREYKEKLVAYMAEKNLEPQRKLVDELMHQKILRAAYSNNQLQEVLTSFWFNHFNVSLTNKDCVPFITAYERDAIRPHALGNFETLLLATAKSPAMLTFLDNYKSSAPGMPKPDTARQKFNANGKLKKTKPQGLNENYAREVMELHTLGVEGGYTQKDVTEAARVLTGWTIAPLRTPVRMKMETNKERLQQRGFVQEGNFIFAANRHDTGEKLVLGTTFPAGGGYQEGVKLLHILAHHPSTAKLICSKLAIRFVNDTPPKSLLDEMARTFTETQGDIKSVLITMVSAPQFWRTESLRAKTKSPFELAISAVRSLEATIETPEGLSDWITRMGEKLYHYQAPTGFPDKGQYWINTGSLLNRMNFGLVLASGQIPGIRFDLLALNQQREPESAEAALNIYSRLLLPERNVDETITRLKPQLNDPQFSKKINAAANDHISPGSTQMGETEEEMVVDRKEKLNRKAVQTPSTAGNHSMLAQVVGIIIGSPEFQRR